MTTTSIPYLFHEILKKQLMQPRDERGHALHPVSYYSQWRAPNHCVRAFQLSGPECTHAHYKDPMISIYGEWTVEDDRCYVASLELVSRRPVPWENLSHMDEDWIPYFAYFMNVNVITDRVVLLNFRHDSVNEWWYEDMIGFWHGTTFVEKGWLHHTRRMAWSITSSILSTIQMMSRFCLLHQSIGHRSIFPLYLYHITPAEVEVAGDGVAAQE